MSSSVGLQCKLPMKQNETKAYKLNTEYNDYNKKVESCLCFSSLQTPGSTGSQLVAQFCLLLYGFQQLGM